MEGIGCQTQSTAPFAVGRKNRTLKTKLLPRASRRSGLVGKRKIESGRENDIVIFRP